MGIIDWITGRNIHAKLAEYDGLLLPPRDKNGRFIKYKDPEKHRAAALRQKKARAAARSAYFSSKKK